MAPPYLHTNEFGPKTFFNAQGPIQGFSLSHHPRGSCILFLTILQIYVNMYNVCITLKALMIW
jgi:hypothetical protein